MKKGISFSGFRVKLNLRDINLKNKYLLNTRIKKCELDFLILPMAHLHHKDIYWLNYYQTSKYHK